MNFMKRLMAGALALVATSSVAMAQIGDLRYRVEAGVTSSKITKYGIGEALTGFRVSGLVVLPFEYSKFSLVSGLTLTSKGETQKFYDNGSGDPTAKRNTSLMYLQLPVEAVVRFDLAEDHKVYLGVGPYLAFALSGNAKLGTEEIKLLKSYHDTDAPFKRMELGAGLSLAYAYKDIYLRGGVELSLTDVVNANSSYVKSHLDTSGIRRHGLLYLTLGYQF